MVVEAEVGAEEEGDGSQRLVVTSDLDGGFLKECDENEREGSLAINRAIVDVRFFTGGKKKKD